MVETVLDDFKEKSRTAADRTELLLIAGATLRQLVPGLMSVVAAIREPIDPDNPYKTQLVGVCEIEPHFAELEEWPEMESAEVRCEYMIHSTIIHMNKWLFAAAVQLSASYFFLCIIPTSRFRSFSFMYAYTFLLSIHLRPNF